MEYCNALERDIVIALKRYPGAIRAISAQNMAADFKTTERQIRATISHLREDHHLPICSTPNEGFFWPTSRAEAAHTLKCFRSREDALMNVRKGIEEGLEILFSQPSLFDEVVA